MLDCDIIVSEFQINTPGKSMNPLILPAPGLNGTIIVHMQIGLALNSPRG